MLWFMTRVCDKCRQKCFSTSN